MTYGRDKYGRPDLKQVMIGLSIYSIEDLIKSLCCVLTTKDWNRLTYAADSALATMDKVTFMVSEDLSSTTLLRDNFEL